ncbi:MAG TPA: AsmA family protein [Xanthobacteraceae bacterium]|nr:AsmA family protein [Xanthobacteraceae bacterium]
MQTTLLGLAIAIIVALVTALVAPVVVDWNQYRSAFEDEASRLTGLSVRVSGPIEARLLPTPRLKLGDVAAGAPGREPQLRAGVVDVEVGLGPLLRGHLQATELRLVAPRIALGLDRSGAIGWPAPSPTLPPDALAISGLHVEDGRVTLADAGSGSRLVLQKLSFDGDIRSFAGPFRGEGAFVVGDEAYGYRISGNRIDEGGRLKLRLGVEPSDRPLTTEIDGTLSFAGGVPQFDGTLALARLAGATLARGQRVLNEPWQLAGKVRATPAAASLQDLAFQYGPEERAVNFGGKGELTFGAHPHLDGTVSAMQVDVDRALAAPDVTHRAPFVMIRDFLEAFVAAAKPPIPTTVAVAVEALTVGGTTLQSLHGNVGFDDEGWNVKEFGFHAPGFTEVNLSGRLDAGVQGLGFSGPASLESADLKVLMAWLEGHTEPPAGRAEAFAARGMVSIASNRFALDRLSASLDQEKLEGRLAYAWAAADRPARLDGELHAAKLDLDALTAFAKAAMVQSTFEMPREATLVVDVGSAAFAGVDARTINARVKFDAGVLHIDRLAVGDLGGAALDISGRIDELSSQPRGRLTLDLDAKTLAGLAAIAGKLAPQAAETLRRVAERLAPAKVHSVLTVDRAATAGTVAKLDLVGDAGALRLILNGDATGALAHPDAATVRVAGRLQADDGGALTRLLHLDRVLAVDQLPGEMTISAAGPLDGDLRVNGLAAAGGFAVAVEGVLHPSGADAPTGRLQVKVSAADLRPLHQAMTGQPGSAVSLRAASHVAVAGGTLSFTDLDVAAAKASLHGRLAVKLASPVGIEGDVEASDADLAAAAAMILGLPSAGAGAAWSAEPIGSGAFGAVSGAVTFKVDRAALTPAWTAREIKGVVRFQPAAIVFGDIDGDLAGGRLTGELTFRRDASELAAQGRLALAGAKAATILASKKNAVDGLLTVALQADSAGLSPTGFIGSVRGSGAVQFADVHVAGIDPAAFDAAIRAVDASGAIETPKIRAAVAAAMEAGGLTVPQSTAEVTIGGGQIRLAKTILPTQNGAELLLDGILDLNSAAIDANVTLAAQPAANALISARPELGWTLKGPLAAPEPKLDISALVGWLTLRATELQTRRLQSIEANQRPEARGPVVRPAAPSVRYIPAGTTVETAIEPDAAAAATGGPRGLDRLRPEAPAALPESRLDHGGAAAPAPSSSAPSSARSKPPPSDRSLLEMLFRSPD